MDLTFEEYITDGLADHLATYGDAAGFDALGTTCAVPWAKSNAVLGGARYQTLRAVLNEALEDQARGGDGEGHRVWIETLLTEYYDPMYDYQLEKSRTGWCFPAPGTSSGRLCFRNSSPKTHQGRRRFMSDAGVTLITGAGSGMGRLASRRWASRGASASLRWT